MNDIDIPEKYVVYQQDLSQDCLVLRIMGEVNSIFEAKTMCKMFNEVDPGVKRGEHTYVFACVKMKGDNYHD